MEDFYYKNKDLDLIIDMVLYEYEQNDVLLICRDKKEPYSSSYYLCINVEFRFKQDIWIISEIDVLSMLKMLCKETTFYETIENAYNIFKVVDGKFDKVDFSELTEEDLPTKEVKFTYFDDINKLIKFINNVKEKNNEYYNLCNSFMSKIIDNKGEK